MGDEPATDNERSPSYRPRLVWCGVALMLIGMVIAGAGIAVTSVAWSIIGAAMVVFGGVISWVGGIQHDARAKAHVAREARDVITGGRRKGRSAANQLSTPSAMGRSAHITGKARRRRSWSQSPDSAWDRRTAPRVMLAVCIWMFLSPWALGYPFTVDGQDEILRQFGATIVVALCAIFTLQVGRNHIVLAIWFFAGLGLLLAVIAFPPPLTRILVNQLLVAATSMVLAGLSTIVNSRNATGND